MTDKPAFTPADETRGLAFAGYALTNALLDTLERMTLLNAHDVQQVLDMALTRLEHRAQDGAIDIARRLIEGNAIARSARRASGSAD